MNSATISILEVLKCDGKNIVFSEFQRSIPALRHCGMTPKDFTGDLYFCTFVTAEFNYIYFLWQDCAEESESVL